jgi:hypothetical protein
MNTEPESLTLQSLLLDLIRDVQQPAEVPAFGAEAVPENRVREWPRASGYSPRNRRYSHPAPDGALRVSRRAHPGEFRQAA